MIKKGLMIIFYFLWAEGLSSACGVPSATRWELDEHSMVLVGCMDASTFTVGTDDFLSHQEGENECFMIEVIILADDDGWHPMIRPSPRCLIVHPYFAASFSQVYKL